MSLPLSHVPEDSKLTMTKNITNPGAPIQGLPGGLWSIQSFLYSKFNKKQIYFMNEIFLIQSFPGI